MSAPYMSSPYIATSENTINFKEILNMAALRLDEVTDEFMEQGTDLMYDLMVNGCEMTHDKMTVLASLSYHDIPLYFTEEQHFYAEALMDLIDELSPIF